MSSDANNPVGGHYNSGEHGGYASRRSSDSRADSRPRSSSQDYRAGSSGRNSQGGDPYVSAPGGDPYMPTQGGDSYRPTQGGNPYTPIQDGNSNVPSQGANPRVSSQARSPSVPYRHVAVRQGIENQNASSQARHSTRSGRSSHRGPGAYNDDGRFYYNGPVVPPRTYGDNAQQNGLSRYVEDGWRFTPGYQGQYHQPSEHVQRLDSQAQGLRELCDEQALREGFTRRGESYVPISRDGDATPPSGYEERFGPFPWRQSRRASFQYDEARRDGTSRRYFTANILRPGTVVEIREVVRGSTRRRLPSRSFSLNLFPTIEIEEMEDPRSFWDGASDRTPSGRSRRMSFMHRRS